MVSLSVLIPTTGRRPEILSRVSALWRESAAAEGYTVEILTTCLYTWGGGVNHLGPFAKGDYVALVPDDVLPCPGLFGTAAEAIDEGVIPVGRYFHENGEPLHEHIDLLQDGDPGPWSRCFILPADTFREIGAMLDATWFADIEYSERLSAAGWRFEARAGYYFEHLDSERDWLTDEEQERSRSLYEQSVRERTT